MSFDITGFLAAAWRRRRLALIVAATGCVLGWSALALLTPTGGSSERARTTASAGTADAALDEVRAQMRADLETARRSQLEVLGALAATPATLGEGDDAGPNPMHQRLLTLQERHRQSIASLERRWASLRPRRPAGSPTEVPMGGPEPPATARAIHLAARLGAVPLVALVVGVAIAGWCGRRDHGFDDIRNLEAATGLPVLGAIGQVGRGLRS